MSLQRPRVLLACVCVCVCVCVCWGGCAQARLLPAGTSSCNGCNECSPGMIAAQVRYLEEHQAAGRKAMAEKGHHGQDVVALPLVAFQSYVHLQR